MHSLTLACSFPFATKLALVRVSRDGKGSIAMQEVGDHVGLVLAAYLFVFGIQTAASSYDYISGKWQTVASARRRGMRHISLFVFPMLYILAYIKF